MGTDAYDVIDYDNGRFFIFESRGSELYYFTEYRINDDGDPKIVDDHHGLTYREVKNLANGPEFLARIEESEAEE